VPSRRMLQTTHRRSACVSIGHAPLLRLSASKAWSRPSSCPQRHVLGGRGHVRVVCL
jgi:hypothetical protein